MGARLNTYVASGGIGRPNSKGPRPGRMMAQRPEGCRWRVPSLWGTTALRGALALATLGDGVENGEHALRVAVKRGGGTVGRPWRVTRRR
jgi:hypothetical protein